MSHPSAAHPFPGHRIRGHVVAAIAVVAATTMAGLHDAAATQQAKTGPREDGEEQLPQGSQPVDLKPGDFTVDIDNRYWPMKPGTRWTYHDVAADGTEADIEIIVTNRIKKLANGIKAREIRDTVRVGGQITEDTKDWYAQDDSGNIWYFGEDTAEFDHGRVISRHGSFEAYVNGALPGVVIPGDPEPGMAYRQEYFKGEAEDNGEVLSTHELVQVPLGKYRDALLTRDTITIEPDVQQYKLYAPGVGPILSLSISGGSGGREELVKVDTVGPDVGTGPLGQP
jgi:hypothetical protein